MAQLANPRDLSDAEATRLAADLPAVAFMNHANDGNESIAAGALPSGVASRIQFLVTCEREKADAESPPIVLAR